MEAGPIPCSVGKDQQPPIATRDPSQGGRGLSHGLSGKGPQLWSQVGKDPDGGGAPHRAPRAQWKECSSHSPPTVLISTSTTVHGTSVTVLYIMHTYKYNRIEIQE